MDYCNVQFKTYGLPTASYELEKDFSPFFDLGKEKNICAVIRINICD